MVVLSYGGGTNSTAMLVGLWERVERPDVITFADTGGEKPHTYQHINDVNAWLVGIGFPEIQIVSDNKTLERDCIDRQALPSIAYGMKTCSQRYKIQPQEKFIRQTEAWKSGEVITRLIGYDFGEKRRAEKASNTNEKFVNRYPLIEWGWGRKECVAAIARAGLPQPGKSACFFCPSSKPSEILDLAKRYPDLMARALAMEANANLTTIKGLGRDYSWKDLLAWNESQLNLFESEWSTAEVICECFDGCA